MENFLPKMFPAIKKIVIEREADGVDFITQIENNKNEHLIFDKVK